MRLRLAHLYPREMNLYGDTGNVLTIVRRLQWLGHSCDVAGVQVGEPFDFTTVDFVLGGGGPDTGQRNVGQDLLLRADDIGAAVAAGVPMLAVCGMYQLFGTSYTTKGGEVLAGIGVFDAATRAGTRRITGDLLVASRFGPLEGYENHSGETLLGAGQEPLGRVRRGTGNSRRARTEGAVTGSAIGTYLHGPVLPRNPALADHLILQALRRHDGSATLQSLPDTEFVAGTRTPRRRSWSLSRARLSTGGVADPAVTTTGQPSTTGQRSTTGAGQCDPRP